MSIPTSTPSSTLGTPFMSRERKTPFGMHPSTSMPNLLDVEKRTQIRRNSPSSSKTPSPRLSPSPSYVIDVDSGSEISILRTSASRDNLLRSSSPLFQPHHVSDGEEEKEEEEEEEEGFDEFEVGEHVDFEEDVLPDVYDLKSPSKLLSRLRERLKDRIETETDEEEEEEEEEEVVEEAGRRVLRKRKANRKKKGQREVRRSEEKKGEALEEGEEKKQKKKGKRFLRQLDKVLMSILPFFSQMRGKEEIVEEVDVEEEGVGEGERRGEGKKRLIGANEVKPGQGGEQGEGQDKGQERGDEGGWETGGKTQNKSRKKKRKRKVRVGGYNRMTFKEDIMAGITVAVTLIPQALAYSIIAGLPAIR
jgi:hypothetical protein